MSYYQVSPNRGDLWPSFLSSSTKIFGSGAPFALSWPFHIWSCRSLWSSFLGLRSLEVVVLWNCKPPWSVPRASRSHSLSPQSHFILAVSLWCSPAGAVRTCQNYPRSEFPGSGSPSSKLGNWSANLSLNFTLFGTQHLCRVDQRLSKGPSIGRLTWLEKQGSPFWKEGDEDYSFQVVLLHLPITDRRSSLPLLGLPPHLI